MATAWPITGTVDQAWGRAPATSRPKKSNAEFPATGRKSLEVSETVVNQLKFANLHFFYVYACIFSVFHTAVYFCLFCAFHVILLYWCSFHAADCKYKFGNWGECDTASSTKSRTGTLQKALFNVDCQQTISVSKPCATKVKNKPKGTSSTPNPKLTANEHVPDFAQLRRIPGSTYLVWKCYPSHIPQPYPKPNPPISYS